VPMPNLFLIYVTDIERSTASYRELFDVRPKMLTPRYVPFEIGPGVLFALWNGRSEQVSPDLPRTSELGLMLPRSQAAVEDCRRVVGQGRHVVEEPHDEVFGRTFFIAHPDGNLIRVSPVD
jgi:catechol 2,3-dioxygenase-like lactoylglutathione lyase family enzyme